MLLRLLAVSDMCLASISYILRKKKKWSLKPLSPSGACEPSKQLHECTHVHYVSVLLWAQT